LGISATGKKAENKNKKKLKQYINNQQWIKRNWLLSTPMAKK
jgi:hypothetical protein